MKENDKSVARQRRSSMIRKVILVVVAVVVIVAMIGQLGLLQISNHSSSSSSLSSQRRSISSGTAAGGRRKKINRDSSATSSSLSSHRRHSRKKNKKQSSTRKRDESSSVIQSVLQGRVHLISLTVVHDELQRSIKKHNAAKQRDTDIVYNGIYGTFCRLDWSLHKTDPSSYPMFKDLLAASKGCDNDDDDDNNNNKRIERVNIYDLVQQARMYDTLHTDTVKVLNLTAVVFHESRCGSTLTANLLSAVNPTQHRVYSESTPPAQALHQICGDDHSICSLPTAATIFRDVVYLMSRTDDMNEERVFFKIQSIGSRNIPVFTTAFPTTPYLFVYRDPVQVMMSHLKRGTRSANCLRSRRFPPSTVENVVAKYAASATADASSASSVVKARHLIPEDYCAAHLASITETIVQHMTMPPGIPINYVDLPEALYTTIFPQLLSNNNEPLSSQQLADLQRVASIYSKNRGGNRVDGEFQSDSALKDQQASVTIRNAANQYLLPSYQKLEALSAAWKTSATRSQ